VAGDGCLSLGNVLLGTSGWSYKEWEGNFYQEKEKRKLRAYSSVFKTVEIDSTFYRYPSKGAVMGWLKYSPGDFVFSAKLPKLITHDKKLGLKGEVKADLDSFLDLMRPLQLGGKLACLLIQLPPKYDFNLENLEAFFGLLDPVFRYAVEFRNLSWMRPETWDLLKKHEVAYVNVDEPLLPSEVHLTSDFAYFRWHGHGEKIWFDYRYGKEELEPWVPKIEETSRKVKKIIGYFNNHFHGYAPENCLYLIERLGLTSEAQKKAKKNVSNKQSQLSGFF
jgi:uncharacterized protein YecE (DUF72 family)